ncbi:MAG: hypothetical protein WBY53_11195 [Acidobacteriaceae bacterium]
MASPKLPDLPEIGCDQKLFPGDAEAVLEELGRTLQSRHFRSCKQGKRFFQYIVEQTLQGNTSLLKERLLGTALFGREPNYATGEDSVVRVEASDVRRRLEAYRAENTGQSPIVIELPVGSYVPVFRKVPLKDAEAVAQPSIVSDAEGVVVLSAANVVVLEPDPSEAPHSVRAADGQPIRQRGPWLLFFLFASLAVGSVVLAMVYPRRRPDTAISAPEKLSEAFWAPLVSSPGPVVVCLGQWVVYRPSDSYYRRYTKTHPGEFVTDYERLTQALPLSSTDLLHAGDIAQASSNGFTIGTLRSAIDLGGYLAQRHKPYVVRVGTESSFAELRNSPAVLVGAFNNRWTLNLTSGLHFRFTENSGELSVSEEAPSNRSWAWKLAPSGSIVRDYAIITRQPIWKAGQSVISVAGLGDGGTEAASEMVTNPNELADVLKTLPAGWEKKNLQIVISTDMTDGEAGRPRLVAYYLW